MTQFNLHDDVLSQVWTRYYYTVEANSLEEAVNKIIDGDVDPTDSEELVRDDMPPEDNPTEEIYYNNEKVWDNLN